MFSLPHRSFADVLLLCFGLRQVCDEQLAHQAEKISDLEQKLGDCTPGSENIPMELAPETTISGTESTSAMDQQVETQSEATEKAQGAKDVAETSASGEAEQVEALESEASFGRCVGIQSSVIQLEPL